MGFAAEVVPFVKQLFGEFSEDDCMTLAASLAYYIVFSLAPLLLVVIAIAGLVVSPEEAQRAMYGQFQYLIGAEGADQIKTMIEHVQQAETGSWIARIFGIVILLFGATGVMVNLQNALNRVWGVKPDPEAGGAWRFVTKRLLSFAMILGIAFLLLVSLVMSAAASAIADRASHLLPQGLSDAAIQAVELGISFVIIAILFAFIFKFLPEAVIRWKDVAIGALATAFLFVLGKFGIGLYLGNSNVGSAYGAASSLAILFVWVYYSSLIVLLGAEFTQVWTRRYGAGLKPAPGTVLVEQKEEVVGHGPPAESPA